MTVVRDHNQVDGRERAPRAVYLLIASLDMPPPWLHELDAQPLVIETEPVVIDAPQPLTMPNPPKEIPRRGRHRAVGRARRVRLTDRA